MAPDRVPRRPTISVVTPSYQQGAFLGRAIRSVLDQDYAAAEYFVLDGGSSDESLNIIRSFADRLTGWRSGPDQGQAGAVNEGWERATGDILGWLNSDDYYLPGAFSAVADWFAEDPARTVVYGRCELVDDQGQVIGHMGEPLEDLRYRLTLQSVPQPSVFLRRSAWLEAGGLDAGLRYAMDYDLFLRIFRAHRPGFIDRPLSGATVHRGAKTTRDRARAKQEALRVAARYGSPLERAAIFALRWAAFVYHRLPLSLREAADAYRDHPTRYARG